MADAMDTLKSILGDNAEDTIRSVMSSLGGGENSGGGNEGNSGGIGSSGGGDLGALLGNLGIGSGGPSNGGNNGNGGNSGGTGAGPSGRGQSPLSNIDPESMAYLMQIRDIMSKITDSHSDSRSNLLMSLKPYMRDTRKHSIDSAVRLLNISKLAGLFRF